MDSRISQTPGLDFLLTEIETGLTFANLANSSQPEEGDKVVRNVKNARTAYDKVLQFRQRVKLDKAANAKLDASLKRLQTALQDLGEGV